MASKYKRDETDLMAYKLEVLERRLDNIERTLMSHQTSSKNDINTELLHMLLGMVKQQSQPTLTPTLAQHPVTSTSVLASAECALSDTVPAVHDQMDTFGFGRRRTLT
jgi:hypothetical protein